MAAVAETVKSVRSDLQLKLVWLTVFRVVATTLLLLASALRLVTRSSPESLTFEDSASFGLIGFIYVLTLISGLALRWGRVGMGVAYLQVAGDLLVATAVVYLTGGLDSPFTFTYSVAVIAGAILLPQRGAITVALLGAASFAAQAVLIQQGLLRPPLGTGPVTFDRLGFALASNALAQLLVAALVGYLARQLSAAGGRLSQREEEMKTLAALQRQILACMPSGLVTCTAAGHVTFVNRAAEAILELPGEGERPAVERMLPGVLKVPTARGRHELTVETPRGKKTLGLSVTPLEGSPGGALLIVFQDLTELKKMEDDLRRADRLAALGSLAAQLAHEIRNPLASMRGSAQLLAQDLKGHSSGRLSTILLRESDRLTALVEDFLKFARPPPPALVETQLDQLVAETVEMLKIDPLSRGVDMAVEAEPARCPADAGQLRQVLLNLVRNALEAAKPGGRVRVRVESAAPGPRIHVWDSAGAIPPADLDRIFEPFFTTRDRGTGLGLSTAHSIVQAHGGTISVSSAPQQGTEFVVELPGTQEAHLARAGGG
ncbi:MAG TPA: ATP-binding protein [Myxococcales bacterium]|nr:ATP-binding protein [Myxococcales bacterium]